MRSRKVSRVFGVRDIGRAEAGAVMRVITAATGTLLRAASAVCHTLASHLNVLFILAALGFLEEQGAAVPPHCSGRASHCAGFSGHGVWTVELGSFSSCST